MQLYLFNLLYAKLGNGIMYDLEKNNAKWDGMECNVLDNGMADSFVLKILEGEGYANYGTSSENEHSC